TFVFQAEDGIRYFHVTGVQTCALPILAGTCHAAFRASRSAEHLTVQEAEPRVLAGGPASPAGGEAAQIVHRGHAVVHRLPGEVRSEEHTSELQSRENLVCRLLLEKKKK